MKNEENNTKGQNEQLKEAVDLLETSLKAFNQIPNTRLHKGNTYQIASDIGAFLKKLKEANIPR